MVTYKKIKKKKKNIKTDKRKNLIRTVSSPMDFVSFLYENCTYTTQNEWRDKKKNSLVEREHETFIY